MRLNELHKFSDGTLTRVMEKLDHMVKDFHLFEYNKGMESRKWSEDDKRRSQDFITAIEKRLQIIEERFRSLESFVGGRIRDIDYRLINRTTYPILLSFTHCGNKSILRVLRIIIVISPEHPSETMVFHNEDGNPARANIKQALGSFKDGDGDGDTQFQKLKITVKDNNLKWDFRSSRRHFKTLSLDELRSPDFNLLSDQEYSEEEEAKAMAETMEQYMIIEPNRGSDNEDANETHSDISPNYVDLFMFITSRGSIMLESSLDLIWSDKVIDENGTNYEMEEINNFQQEPDETLYQAWECFKELLMKCPQHYLYECRMTAADAKIAIQEMAEYSQKWHNGTSRGRSTETSDGLAAIQAQLNNLGREIKKVSHALSVGIWNAVIDVSSSIP
ncbi:hypothetical protein Tco_1092226 [Tanacetum coccineum]|uniref:Uncharacterized protein n=1 Tax=Tanacetum coccineum TaxID=301880 RepID=A0ABQ5I9A9_9ASTR